MKAITSTRVPARRLRAGPTGSPRSAGLALFVLAIGACAAPARVEDPGPDHPASPRAAEAPVPGAPAALAGEPRASAEAHTPAIPAMEPDAGGAHDAGAHDADPPPAARYACPMHPAVVSDRPGECPICKMELERVRETHEHAEGGAR